MTEPRRGIAPGAPPPRRPRRARHAVVGLLLILYGPPAAAEDVQPSASGRFYPVPRQALWDALVATLEPGGRFTTLAPDTGVLITRPVNVRSKALAGLGRFEVLPGFVAELVTWHAFVPTGVDPTRLYVGTVVRSRDPWSRDVRIAFQSGPPEAWLHARVEAALGVESTAIPRDPVARGNLVRELAGASDSRCAGIPGSIVRVDEGGVRAPVLIPESRLAPIYPELTGDRARPVQVVVEAVVDEAGAVSSVWIPRDAKHDPEVAVTARELVRMWRFHAAIADGCAVPVVFKVTVDSPPR